MSDDMHYVNTCVDEGNAFVRKHPELNDAQATMGAWAWGLWHALLECPNCPGVFRRPRMTTLGVEVLWCPQCEGQWIHKDDLAKLKEGKVPHTTWELTYDLVRDGVPTDRWQSYVSSSGPVSADHMTRWWQRIYTGYEVDNFSCEPYKGPWPPHDRIIERYT